jgi:hypothetical protein
MERAEQVIQRLKDTRKDKRTRRLVTLLEDLLEHKGGEKFFYVFGEPQYLGPTKPQYLGPTNIGDMAELIEGKLMNSPKFATLPISPTVVALAEGWKEFWRLLSPQSFSSHPPALDDLTIDSVPPELNLNTLFEGILSVSDNPQATLSPPVHTLTPSDCVYK